MFFAQCLLNFTVPLERIFEKLWKCNRNLSDMKITNVCILIGYGDNTYLQGIDILILIGCGDNNYLQEIENLILIGYAMEIMKAICSF